PACGKRVANALVERLGFRRKEFAAYPPPNRRKRRAHDVPLVFVRGIAIEQECIEWPQKLARDGIDPRRTFARFARRVARFLQESLASWNVVAAQGCALEFCNQKRARCRRQLPKVLAQALDGQPAAVHPAHHKFNATERSVLASAHYELVKQEI